MALKNYRLLYITAGMIVVAAIFIYGIFQLEQMDESNRIDDEFVLTLAADQYAEFNSLINTAYENGYRKVVIPAGKYHIEAKSNQSHHFNFANLSDFEIDATDVTFILRDPRKGAIRFNHSQDVTLKGLTIDYETLTTTQGEIVDIANDGSYVDLLIDEGYPENIDDPAYFFDNPIGYFFEKDTLMFKKGGPDFYSTGIERLEDRLFRIYWDGNANDHSKIGNLMAFRGVFSHTILIGHSGGMQLEDITILASAGFGIHEHDSPEQNKYTNIRLTPGPKPSGAARERILASSADGFHSTNARVGPWIERSLFEKMGDDGIAIHGVYSLVMESVGREVIISASWAGNPIQVNDSVRFYDDNMHLIGESYVVEVTNDIDYDPKDPPVRYNFEGLTYHRLLLDQDIDGLGYKAFVNTPNANGSGYVIIENKIQNHRARGMLLKADRGLVEGNYLEGNTMYGILIEPESYWSEGDYSRDVIIRNNVFKHTGWNNAALSISGYDGSLGHHNITIDQNEFYLDKPGINVVMSEAHNVIFNDNQLTYENFPEEQQRAMIPLRLSNLNKVTLSGNEINGEKLTSDRMLINKNVEGLQIDE